MVNVQSSPLNLKIFRESIEKVNSKIIELGTHADSFNGKDGRGSTSHGYTHASFAFSPRYNALKKAKTKIKEIETLNLNTNRGDDSP